MEPPFRITICGIEELAGHCETGVSHVLSILDPDHPVPEAFGAFGEHAKLELRFYDVLEDTPGIPGPTEADVARLLAFGRDLVTEPAASAHLLVHCHAGISRSTASMALMLAQAMPEAPAEAVMAHVLAVRDKAWPNLRILEMGDAMLGRGGALARAAHGIYRHQLEIRPHLAEFMINAGREREVEAGRALLAGRS
ncbi:MAG TPA: protein-tyrosine-phosphatase [Acetobacteraceae bacterium]|nr:protein-tyrosine-phosphatase [Acetobacteraceae bacterium]